MADSITASMSTNGMTDDEKAEHEKKMVDVAENGATTLSAKDSRTPEGDVDLTQQSTDGDTDVAKRPDDVPEKFWDAEKGEVNVAALLKSQADGEAALRNTDKTEKPEDKPEGDSTEKPAADDAAQEKTVADASAEYAEKGELSADTYAALEKSGLSKDMVNDYIEGQKAIVTTLQNAAFGEFTGGKEAYEAATDWANENLNEEEIQALDVQITSRNPGIVKQGAAALAAKYAAGADITPDTTVTGGGNTANAGSHFKSGQEMRTAMADPKYKTDPAFRAEVSNKIANADRAGVDLFV